MIRTVGKVLLALVFWVVVITCGTIGSLLLGIFVVNVILEMSCIGEEWE